MKRHLSPTITGQLKTLKRIEMNQPYRHKRTKLRSISKRGESHSLATHPADIWLPRLSHFSQFALFLVTLGSLYFTVIPLYQKAAMEEQIARREAEFKEVERSLEESYGRLRGYAIKGFVFGAGASCTGLLTPPQEPGPQDEKATRRLTFAEQTLRMDVGKCLVELAEKANGLNDLRPQDRLIFIGAVKETAERISKQRLAALAAYEEVPNLARSAPETLSRPDPYTEQYLKFIASKAGISPETIEKQRLKASITATQSHIATVFGKEAREQVAALRDIKWEHAETPKD